MTEAPSSYTSFEGHRRIAGGSLQANALAVKKALESRSPVPVLIFDDATGRSIDIDTRGTDEEVRTRFAAGAETAAPGQDDAPQADAPKSRGRPKLGVVAREVTLLPRHWDWLAAQPGGASVALRKLVEDARRANAEKDTRRKTQERAYHFMSAMAGDLPGFEEAARALFANDTDKVRSLLASWPGDVRDHAMRLAFETA